MAQVRKQISAYDRSSGGIKRMSIFVAMHPEEAAGSRFCRCDKGKGEKGT